MKNKFARLWRNFWGTKYWIVEDNKKTKEILLYHKKLYIREIGKEN